MLAILAKILKTLNSEQSPSQIAAAISLAAIIGFTPLLSLHNIIVLFIVLFFRVNLTMFLVAWPLFSILGLAFSPASQAIGISLLQQASLQPIWESFYNTLVGRWSNFYYSGVIGGLVLGVAIAIVAFPLSKLFIVRYRESWMDKMEKLHLVKLLKASSFWHTTDKHTRNSIV